MKTIVLQTVSAHQRREGRLPAWLILGLVLLYFLLLSGCAAEANEMAWLEAPDWSRGVTLGTTTTREGAPIATDPQGNLYFFLIHPEEGPDQLQVVSLDRNAQERWAYFIGIEGERVDRPELVWDNDALRLLWIDSARLFTTRVSTSGELLEAEQLISGDVVVDDYDFVLRSPGEIVLWYSGSKQVPGLYATLLSDSAGPPTLVDPQGIRPALQMAADGVLHAAWVRQPNGPGATRFYYAAYPDAQLQQNVQIVVQTESIPVGSILQGPFIGLSPDRVYLFSTQYIQTGPNAGLVDAKMVHFPVGHPDKATVPQPIQVLDEYRVNYDSSQGEFKSGLRVKLPGEYATRSTLTDMDVLDQTAGEVVVAFNTQMPYLWNKTEGQVGLIYLQDGAVTSYQLLSFSSRNSTSPVVMADDSGYLYITYLEKGDDPGYIVYFAATAPDLVASLDRLRLVDISAIAMETAFGMLVGALLTPIAATIWVIPGLLVLLLTTFIRRTGDDRVIDPGSVISLGLALAAYWALKLGSLSGFSAYVPFTAWIPLIPAWLNEPIRLATPILIGLLGLLVAWRSTYGRGSKSVLYFMMIYAAVDGLLTLAVYGVLIFGAY